MPALCQWCTKELIFMKRKAFQAVLPYTLPIFIGFLFIGLSYGFLMASKGFSIFYPIIMSIVIFAGAMQFVAVSLLLSAFHPLYAFLMTLMVNARHLFYGISMLEKYKGTGWKKPYLLFGLGDEAFSINCTVEPPAGVDKNWFRFFVTLLIHLYWIVSTVLGAVLGAYIRFDTTGIDFVMTALFVVLFLGQWEHKSARRSAITGIACTLLALAIFGSSQFVIPAMILITGILLWKKNVYLTKEDPL